MLINKIEIWKFKYDTDLNKISITLVYESLILIVIALKFRNITIKHIIKTLNNYERKTEFIASGTLNKINQ